MQTKHAHEHFDLIIHMDIKTSKIENFSIIFDVRLFTALIRIHALSELVNVTNQTFIMKHRPVARGWRAMCTCTRVDHKFMQPKWTLAKFYVNL